MLQDIFRQYAFCLLVQFIIFIPYAVRAGHFHQTAHKVFLRLLDGVVHAAPPGIPTALLWVGAASKLRLGRLGLDLVFPKALGLAAETDVVCFDKTGTLTGSSVSIFSVISLTQKWCCSA